MGRAPGHPQFIADLTKSVTAQNQFTSAGLIRGYFSLSISGTWVATVHVQRSFDDGVTWLDVNSYTSNTEKKGFEPGSNGGQDGIKYRVGVKTGNYTSGTVVIRLAQ